MQRQQRTVGSPPLLGYLFFLLANLSVKAPKLHGSGSV